MVSCNLLIISHAGIKQINRAVYRHLSNTFQQLNVVIPQSLILSSGKRIEAEPALSDDPRLIPLELIGRNPRTYYYPKMAEILNQIRPEVILLENDPVSRLGFSVSSWCNNNQALLVCQSYENFSRGPLSSFRQRGLLGLLKNIPIHLLNFYMARHVDAMLVINNDGELIFRNYGYRQVIRMPLGYDPSVFYMNESKRADYRTKLLVKNDEVLIAYFGRLVEQKGVHLLIEALSTMMGLRWRLLLDHAHDSSDGYVQRIQNLIAQYKLTERVTYFEADHFEIANYMRAADVMVAPSLTTPNFKEQYGRAVQEAMACGCVCLAADSGHLPDLLGNRMLIFEENNVAQIVGKLTDLALSAAKRNAFSKELSERARRYLTTQEQARVMLSILQYQ